MFSSVGLESMERNRCAALSPWVPKERGSMLRVACQGHRGHNPERGKSTIAAVSSGNGVQPSGSMPLEVTCTASGVSRKSIAK